MLGFSGVTAMMLRCRGSMVLCLDSNGNRTDTLLIGEAWNPTTGAKITPKPSNTITLACRTAALAKCVEFGYRPGIPTCGASFASGGLAAGRGLAAAHAAGQRARAGAGRGPA